MSRWQVVYPAIADNCSSPFVSRLSEVNQPVVRSRIGFHLLVHASVPTCRHTLPLRLTLSFLTNLLPRMSLWPWWHSEQQHFLERPLKALIAFEPLPLGGLSGDGPRGAGSPGRSRAGRAPAGGQPGGTSGARRAVEKPWRGGGAGELLGGTGGWGAGGRGAAGGWDCVKSGFIFQQSGKKLIPR
jgi:hypothetical protein